MIRIPISECTTASPYGYVYITEDTKRHMYYVGMHKCPDGKTFDESYFGSNIRIKRILLSRPETLVCTPIEWAQSPEELCELEKYWIAVYGAADSPMFYNQERGGNGGALTKDALESMKKHRKGQPAWNKGVPCRLETRQKLSAAFTGRTMSEETKRKISASNTGKKMSEEAKAKIAASRVGKKLPAEVVAKMAASRKGKGAGADHWTHKQDYHPSEEHKQKLREIWKGGKSPRALPVYLFSLDGALVHTFKSRSSVGNIQPSAVSYIVLYNARTIGKTVATSDGWVLADSPDYKIQPVVRFINHTLNFQPQQATESEVNSNVNPNGQ